MALNQIWKQQLTLVSYGNEFLAGTLNVGHWREHPIFDRHSLTFRDLLNQHLLAQHFQIWLEGLKTQGVTRLSLHLSSLLNDEQNPNPNVELLSFSHFIVSHQADKKTAWICGQELAEWYNNDQEFEAPITQKISLNQETFWRYELNPKLTKKIATDLQKMDWNDTANFMQRELFDSHYAEHCSENKTQDGPYYGDSTDTINESLALIPTLEVRNCTHGLLHRTQALIDCLEQQRQHPYNTAGELISPEEQINLRNFAHKTDDLFAKLIVKVANHWQTAQITIEPEILDRTMQIPQQSIHTTQNQQHHKVGASGMIKLIILTVIICICAYYFGL